jgi:hypothetical protein
LLFHFQGQTVVLSSESSEILEEKFEQLLNSVASLNHPHVVRYYGLLRPLTLISERTDSTLRNYLNKSRLIPARTFVSLCSAVINAIAFAHNAGCQFGGVCPETVAVCRTGDTVVFKLDVLETQFTPVSEHYHRDGVVGPKFDLFSAGLMLAEVVLKHVRIGNYPVDPKASQFSQSDQAKLVDDACSRVRVASEQLAELILSLGSEDPLIDAAAILAYFPSLTSDVLKREYDDDLPPTAARLRYRYDKAADAVKLTTSEDIVRCEHQEGCKTLLQGTSIHEDVRSGVRKPLPFCKAHTAEVKQDKRKPAPPMAALHYDKKTDTIMAVVEGKLPEPATCRGRKPVTDVQEDVASITSKPRKKQMKDTVCGNVLAGSNIPGIMKDANPEVKLVAYCVECFRAPRAGAVARCQPTFHPIETTPPMLGSASRSTSLDTVESGLSARMYVGNGAARDTTHSDTGFVADSDATAVTNSARAPIRTGNHPYVYDPDANMVFEVQLDGSRTPATCKFVGCGVRLAGVHVDAHEYQRVCKPFCLLHYIKQEVEVNELLEGVVNKSDQQYAVCSVGGCGVVLKGNKAALDQQRKFCRPFCRVHYTRFEWASDGAPSIVNATGDVATCGYPNCGQLLKGDEAVDLVRHQLSCKPYCMHHYGVSPNLVFWDKARGCVVDSLADVVTCRHAGCSRVLEGTNVSDDQQSRAAKPYCVEHYRDTTVATPTASRKRQRDAYFWTELADGPAVVSSATGEVAHCVVCKDPRKLTVASHAICPLFHRRPCVECRGSDCDNCGGFAFRPCKPLCVMHYRDPVVRVQGVDLVEVGSDPPRIATCRGLARDTGGASRVCGKELKGMGGNALPVSFSIALLQASLMRREVYLPPDLPFCLDHLIWYVPRKEAMETVNSMLSGTAPQCIFPDCGRHLNSRWIDPVLQQMATRPFCTWHYKTKYRLDEGAMTVFDAAERVALCKKPGCGVPLSGGNVDVERQRKEARPYCKAHYTTRSDAKKQSNPVTADGLPVAPVTGVSPAVACKDTSDDTTEM